jgi:hypothetical protein
MDHLMQQGVKSRHLRLVKRLCVLQALLCIQYNLRGRNITGFVTLCPSIIYFIVGIFTTLAPLQPALISQISPKLNQVKIEKAFHRHIGSPVRVFPSGFQFYQSEVLSRCARFCQSSFDLTSYSVRGDRFPVFRVVMRDFVSMI